MCACLWGLEEGGSWGESYSLQGSSRGEDPPGTELVLAALRSGN